MIILTLQWSVQERQTWKKKKITCQRIFYLSLMCINFCGCPGQHQRSDVGKLNGPLVPQWEFICKSFKTLFQVLNVAKFLFILQSNCLNEHLLNTQTCWRRKHLFTEMITCLSVLHTGVEMSAGFKVSQLQFLDKMYHQTLLIVKKTV